MSPYELTVLIHHYVSPGLFPQHETGLYKQLCERFVFDGIFSERSLPKHSECPQQTNGYIVTDLGEAWLRAILKTPVPKQVYIDANGDVLE